MATVTFDTYAYIKRLRDAGIPEGQAEAFARAQQDLLAQALDSQLATKLDLAALRTEIADLRTELKVDIANAKAEIIKWTAGLLILQAGVITALVKLL